MAYRRYYRGRRTSRRRTLSNYRIATRTGARAQAKQIYALKKRINYIQKRTKPEIVITRRTATPLASNGRNEPMGGVINFNYGEETKGYFLPQLPGITTELNAAVGTEPPNRFARLLSFKLTGNLNYTATPTVSATPYVLRLIIIQTRTTRAEAIGASDVISESNAVFGPLQTGAARTARILSDRRYYLSYQRPVISIRTSLKRLTNYYTDTTRSTGASTSSEDIAKGTITVVYVYRPMLNAADSELTPTGLLNLQLEGKLAYTDA